jgi:hypothetical protein
MYCSNKGGKDMTRRLTAVEVRKIKELEKLNKNMNEEVVLLLNPLRNDRVLFVYTALKLTKFLDTDTLQRMQRISGPLVRETPVMDSDVFDHEFNKIVMNIISDFDGYAAQMKFTDEVVETFVKKLNMFSLTSFLQSITGELSEREQIQ